MKSQQSETIKKIVSGEPYLVATLHRRENRDTKFEKIWAELNNISSKIKIVYITHPSVKNITIGKDKNIEVLEPLNYGNMIHLLKTQRSDLIVVEFRRR